MLQKQYLHHHKNFYDLLKKVSDDKGIEPSLVEKDYFIMHCLYGLQKQGFAFELKGGTSLSKGYGIIHRFSEDIDICIHPNDDQVKFGRNHTKDIHIQSRKDFYDVIASKIKIDGIVTVQRDVQFDDIPKYRSGGIRLYYEGCFLNLEGIKEGILLELGFDQTTPYKKVTISSWAYDEAIKHIDCLDNRAIDVHCYHPAYTFVEKLQTISILHIRLLRNYKRYLQNIEISNRLVYFQQTLCVIIMMSIAYYIHKMFPILLEVLNILIIKTKGFPMLIIK